MRGMSARWPARVTGVLLDVLDGLLREQWRAGTTAEQVGRLCARNPRAVRSLFGRLAEHGWVHVCKDGEQHLFTLTGDGLTYAQELLNAHHPAYSGGPLLEEPDSR